MCETWLNDVCNPYMPTAWVGMAMRAEMEKYVKINDYYKAGLALSHSSDLLPKTGPMPDELVEDNLACVEYLLKKWLDHLYVDLDDEHGLDTLRATVVGFLSNVKLPQEKKKRKLNDENVENQEQQEEDDEDEPLHWGVEVIRKVTHARNAIADVKTEGGLEVPHFFLCLRWP